MHLKVVGECKSTEFQMGHCTFHPTFKGRLETYFYSADSPTYLSQHPSSLYLVERKKSPGCERTLEWGQRRRKGSLFSFCSLFPLHKVLDLG